MDQFNGMCMVCEETVHFVHSQGLKCSQCQKHIHLKCLQKGTVPGGLTGDTFFEYTCAKCSPTQTEIFEREKMPWLVLYLYSFKVCYIHQSE